MSETTIKQLRAILEAANIKTRHVRNDIVDAIYDGRLQQKSRFSTTITPGTGTIEEFVRTTVAKRKGDAAKVVLDQAADEK